MGQLKACLSVTNLLSFLLALKKDTKKKIEIRNDPFKRILFARHYNDTYKDFTLNDSS
jgi:hypothetical protein